MKKALKFVKIKKITYKGEGKFYSMLVPNGDYRKGNHNYFANGILNSNGGKDLCSVIITLYNIYSLHTMGGAPKLNSNIDITCMNVALNAQQANDAFFSGFKNHLQHAPIFKKIGYEIKNNEVIFPRGIRAFSGSSAGEGLEGRSIFVGILDEIACTHYDTPVLLSTGETMPIGKIVNQKLSLDITTFNFEKSTFETKRIVQFYKYPKTSKFIKIYNKLGTYKRLKSILLTPNHWVFTNRGKIQVKDLNLETKLLQKGQFLNKFQTQFILGTLLGDGCIARPLSACPYFSWTHSIKQEGYIKHKAKILGVLTSGVRTTVPMGYLHTPEMALTSKKITTIQNIVDVVINKTSGRKEITKEWCKQLDAVSLCFWYLDDGSIFTHKRSIMFSTHSYSLVELELLCTESVLREYEPKIYKTKKGYIISINKKENTIRFFNFIKDYIPKSMVYKTIFSVDELTEYYDPNFLEFGYSPIYKLEEVDRTSKVSSYVYDIGVEDNHNYLIGASYNVVSNSFRSKAELKGDKNIIRQQQSADHIYDVIKSSVKSRFPHNGKVILISYPRFRGDFILTKYENYKREQENGIDNRVYLEYAATWEFNPTKTEEDFADEKRRDYTNYLAKYKCVPPNAEDAFLRDDYKIQQIVDFTLPEPINPETKQFTMEFRPKGYVYALGLDLGLTHDRAVLAMTHQERRKSSVTGDEHTTFVIDLIMTWEAPPQGEIQLSDIREFVLNLKQKGFRINVGYIDKFASAQLRQELTTKGIPIENLSIERNLEVWNGFKELISEERLKCYNDRINVDRKDSLLRPLFLNELRGLALINGNRVDHLATGSKDVTDAVVRSIEACKTIKINKSTFGWM